LKIDIKLIFNELSMVTDVVGDMLTRIRNSYMAKHRYTLVIFNKLNLNIASILKNEGFIKDFELGVNQHGYKCIIIYLKYKYTGIGRKPEPILNGIKRISKPGRRIYTNYKKIPIVLGNLGIAIISTSEGLMSNFEAKRAKKGGEIICFVW